MPDAILIVGEDWRVRDANQASARSWHDREGPGRHPLAKLIPRSADGSARDPASVFVDGRSCETELMTSKKSRVPVEVTCRKALSGGESLLIIGMRSIVERRQVEERLRFQAKLLDSVEQAVTATDLAGNITFINNAAAELFRWDPSRCWAGSLPELISPEQDRHRAAGIVEALASGERWSGEETIRRLDGGEFHAEIKCAPLCDENGSVIGLIGAATDITARKRSEEALQTVVNETNERREEITALLESTRYVLERKGFEEASERFSACAGTSYGLQTASWRCWARAGISRPS